MGFALARAAHEAGAQVRLVAGPVSLPTPYGVSRTDVRSALDMHAAVMAQVEHVDVFIATAAVADWRPAQVAGEKIKKGSEGLPHLDWVENPDILADVAASARAQSGGLYCVGFAAETQYLQAQAQAKRTRKGVPLMVGNLGPATFGQDDNALLVIDEQGTQELPRASKLTLARQLMTEIASRISTKEQ
jgi:phosphopantothenoylcysteine decarboxylase/phosphopantothenate--cysteine ligase